MSEDRFPGIAKPIRRVDASRHLRKRVQHRSAGAPALHEAFNVETLEGVEKLPQCRSCRLDVGPVGGCHSHSLTRSPASKRAPDRQLWWSVARFRQLAGSL